ncbi:MAG: lipoate--protein ligase family protein [Clostridium sp.]|nr:lipoate--protein ligase family protein [Clostridium sp.]
MEALFIPYSINNGKYNMDLDEAILNMAIENKLLSPILRLYGWKPACVSLGRNQSDGQINKSYCAEQRIDIVKRLTGGRALLHDCELTYSFVCPINFLQHGETIIQSYKEISTAIAAGFKLLSIETEFPEQKKVSTKFEYCMSLATGADLSYQGKKIVGSAQFRKQGYILQHGSILLNYDYTKIVNIFAEKPVSEKITTINAINKDITVDKLAFALKQGFEDYFKLHWLNLNEESLLHQDTHV